MLTLSACLRCSSAPPSATSTRCRIWSPTGARPPCVASCIEPGVHCLLAQGLGVPCCIAPRNSRIVFSKAAGAILDCTCGLPGGMRRYSSALVLEDDAVFDVNFPALLQEYRRQLEPDWGVLFTDAATSCHWWERCADLPPRRTVPSAFKRSIPMGAFGGAILWNQRGARQLVSTFVPFCLPWDMEIEYHWLRHNTSIFFASPSLIVQGTFLNPSELGHTVSALRGERSGEPLGTSGGQGGGGRGKGGDGIGLAGKPPTPAGESDSMGSLGAVRCSTFSFFDCTASSAHTWDQCVAKRDACGDSSADATPLRN